MCVLAEIPACAPYGYAYGYLDRTGRVRSICRARVDAERNARLNGGRPVVRLPLTASGTVSALASHEVIG